LTAFTTRSLTREEFDVENVKNEPWPGRSTGYCENKTIDQLMRELSETERIGLVHIYTFIYPYYSYTHILQKNKKQTKINIYIYMYCIYPYKKLIKTANAYLHRVYI